MIRIPTRSSSPFEVIGEMKQDCGLNDQVPQGDTTIEERAKLNSSGTPV